jgi:hypothetical protein
MLDLPNAIQELRNASTAHDVVELVREFLGALSEDEQSQLPWGLNRQTVKSAADIAMWALQLRSHTGSTAPGPAFGRVSKVLSDATVRLAELAWAR